jgi:hypothetical protein
MEAFTRRKIYKIEADNLPLPYPRYGAGLPEPCASIGGILATRQKMCWTMGYSYAEVRAPITS